MIKARLYQHQESRETGCVPGSHGTLHNITNASPITMDYPPALVNEVVTAMTGPQKGPNCPSSRYTLLGSSGLSHQRN